MMRWLRFNAVGMMGMAVQLILIAVLVRVFKMHYLPATALAVEVAILHNFLWHVRWTWPDRPLVGLFTLFRFNVAVGVVSMRLLLGPYVSRYRAIRLHHDGESPPSSVLGGR